MPTDTPERIWLFADPKGSDSYEWTSALEGSLPHAEGAVEYVRADLFRPDRSPAGEVTMAAVQAELCRVCDAYAAKGDMAGATAIDDAARCVAALRK